jgi:DNA repair exonuclease SbcCD ATPase subunit
VKETYIKGKAMSEDILAQILAQASDNIQRLFDLSTRIDERVKSIQTKQNQLEKQIDNVINQYMTVLQKIAVLESHRNEADTDDKIKELEKTITSIDKRLTILEGNDSKHSDRWNRITMFIIQIVWAILTAYILMKLNLQAPAVP